MQVAPSMRAHALLPRVSGRVAVTHLNLAGWFLIGVHLFSSAPGIKGGDISFIHPPEIDVKFSPFGMTVTEIPGILNALKVSLQGTVCRLSACYVLFVAVQRIIVDPACVCSIVRWGMAGCVKRHL